MYKLKSLGIYGNYYGLIHSFLSDRHQREVLNGQSSNWSYIKAGVPHFFQWFMILQHLQHGIMILKISRWAYQWKMIFNTHASKQAHEIVFSRKANANNHTTVYFNNAPVINVIFKSI